MDKFCEDCIHNEVCQYGAIPPHTNRCNDKDTLDDLTPKGEWKHIGGDEWCCSNCGHVVTTEGSWETPLDIGDYHCSNCGAKMQKGDTT